MIINYCTGASGFVGKHLLPKLTGETIAIPHQDISTYHFGDFQNFFFLSTYGNMADHQDIVKIFKANVTDVLKTVRQISSMKFESDLFLFVSSSSVNLQVQTSYSHTKAAAEHIIVSSGLPSCIVRPYTIIGVGDNENHLVPKLIQSCMEGTEMDFVPEPTHDYVDVEDVVDGLIYLANNKMEGVYELGSGVATSNQEVLEMVEEATDKKANVRLIESLRDYDTEDWYCKEPVFGWKPKKTLKQSIEEMVETYVR